MTSTASTTGCITLYLVLPFLEREKEGMASDSIDCGEIPYQSVFLVRDSSARCIAVFCARLPLTGGLIFCFLVPVRLRF